MREEHKAKLAEAAAVRAVLDVTVEDILERADRAHLIVTLEDVADILRQVNALAVSLMTEEAK